MNKVYKTVWNGLRQCIVVVSEAMSSQAASGKKAVKVGVVGAVAATGLMIAGQAGAQTVQVEAYSRISYKPHLWNVAGRTVVLDGSACFDVEKGNSFTVKTECGDISVLGTKFKVAEQEGNLKVECFEGLVEVKPSVPQSGKVRLSAGEAVEIKSGNVEKSRLDDKYDITDDKPVQETINYNKR